MKPEATVAVPFFNRKDFLAEAVLSILRQDHSRLQLILIDDGSTDGSDRLAKSFDDPRIEYVRLKSRRGKSAALNAILPRIRGKYFTAFDSDDLMMPNALTCRVDFLERHPRANAVMARVGHFIDKDGNRVSHDHPLLRIFRPALSNARQMARTVGGFLPEYFVFGYCPTSPLSTTLIRSKILRKVGTFDSRFDPCEDREFLMRLAAMDPIPFLDVPVMRYRIHHNNSSFRIVGGQLTHGAGEDRLRALRRHYWQLRPMNS